jgi:hypothetical protein
MDSLFLLENDQNRIKMKLMNLSWKVMRMQSKLDWWLLLGRWWECNQNLWSWNR